MTTSGGGSAADLMIAMSVTPMSPMAQVLARQNFVADLEARNMQTRAWNTLTHSGRLWRSGIRPHDPRFDRVVETVPRNVTTGYYRPGAENQDGVPENPAQLNAPRNAVAMAQKPIAEENGKPGLGQPETGERVTIAQSMPSENGTLGGLAIQNDLGLQQVAESKKLAEEQKSKDLLTKSTDPITALVAEAKKIGDKLASLNVPKEPVPTAVAPGVAVPPAPTTAQPPTNPGQAPPPDPVEEAPAGTGPPQEVEQEQGELDQTGQQRPVIEDYIAAKRAEILDELQNGGSIPRGTRNNNTRSRRAASAIKVARLVQEYVNAKEQAGQIGGPLDDVASFPAIAKARFLMGAPTPEEGEARYMQYKQLAGVRGDREPLHPFATYIGLGKKGKKRSRSSSSSTRSSHESKTSKGSKHSAGSMEKRLLHN
jgi:hypothetical protein